MCFLVVMFKNTFVDFSNLKSVVLTVSKQCKAVHGLKLQICTSIHKITVYKTQNKTKNNLPSSIPKTLMWNIQVILGWGGEGVENNSTAWFLAGTCWTMIAALFWDVSLGNHSAEWLCIVMTATSFGWYYHKFDLMRLHLACSL